MSEPTLSITRGDLKSALGRFLGISRTSSDWTTENAADVLYCIQCGERQFYAPASGHQWSFLTTALSLSLSNGTATYDLPDDFGGFLDSELAFASTKTWALKLVPLKLVLEQTQTYGTSMPTGITQPVMGAVKPKTAFAPATGQRWQIQVWPSPTGSITATGRYRALPNTIDDDAHYPMGSELHSQTLIESCLAAAEEFMNDEDGVHRARFNELMQASIACDLRLHAQEAA
jgi:hypothetical protein